MPGYGLAVAQAQHTLREVTRVLESAGIDVACPFTRWQDACPGT